MNLNRTSVLEVGLVAFLVLAAVVVAAIATDGTFVPVADTPGAAIVKTNAGTGN